VDLHRGSASALLAAMKTGEIPAKKYPALPEPVEKREIRNPVTYERPA